MRNDRRPPAKITSLTNPRIKELVGLRRRRQRETADAILIEGYEELALALTAGVRPKALFYCPDLVREPYELEIVDRIAGLGAEMFELSRPVFEKAAYRESPDGWLAVVAPPSTDLANLQVGDAPLILVCEGVEKPGNLGAMLRTADAAAVSAVIAAGPITDWGNPNLIRASKGTAFSVPLASGTTSEVLDWLRANGIPIVSTTPSTDTFLTEVDLTGPVAIAVGSEKYGLSAEWLARSQFKVKIPMFGRADSLNVATSAAIAVYEGVRQRMLAR